MTAQLEGFLFTITTASGETREVRLQGNGGEHGGGCLAAANMLIGNPRRASYLERAFAGELAAVRAEVEQTGQVRVVDPAAPWETRIEPIDVASVDSVRGLWWPRTAL